MKQNPQAVTESIQCSTETVGHLIKPRRSRALNGPLNVSRVYLCDIGIVGIMLFCLLWLLCILQFKQQQQSGDKNREAITEMHFPQLDGQWTPITTGGL